MTSCKVLLCSGSKHKIGATKDAFQALFDSVEIITENSDSGINSQPFGNEETLRGAKNRINSAKKLYASKTSAPVDYVVAIENGIILVVDGNEERWYDICWVVIEDKTGQQRISVSQGILFPAWAAHEAQKIGFATKTVGEILFEKFPQCEKTDPHSYLTQGKLPRLQFMSLAIRTAFLTAIIPKP